MASTLESAVVETELKKEETVIEDESKENKEETVTDESKEEPVKEVEKEEVEEVEEEEGEVEEKATNGEKRSSEHFATDTPGKRSRKSFEHFKPSTVEPSAKKEVAEEGSGRGLALSDIPWVNEMLDKYSCDQLKPLHKLLFNNTVGNKQGIKQRIRKFNGYSFYAEDQKHASTLARIKFKMSALDRDAIKKIMGLNKSCSAVEIMEFLMEPQDKGKTVPKKTPKKSSSKTTSKKRKSDSSSTPSAAKKQKKQIYSDSDSGSEDDTTPPKKAKISVTKKSSPKPDMPSDEVLTSKVKEVVGELDLDTISMKQAVAKVSEAYLGLDLSEKKQLIKDVIKDMLD